MHLWLLPLLAAAVPLPNGVELQRDIDQFEPTPLHVDLTALPASERAALVPLMRAARIMDALYLRQVWAGNEPLLLELAQDTSAQAEVRRQAFLLYKGPWLELEQNAPFLGGVPPRPPQANFYPSDSTKEEIARWESSLPAPERAAATGFTTVIRRDHDGRLMTVPYNLEYQALLQLAANALREAAQASAQPSLKDFLNKRAAAFLSNDYRESDLAWMALDSDLEPTIGPYEVYEDDWFNAKAAFEAFLSVRDAPETQKLQRLSGQLQWLEDRLPIEPKYRNPKLGALAPIRVVNEIFCSGDANHGTQTAAFNLPNDEVITAQHGTKRVMLKNVQEAKFERVLQPIAAVALTPDDQKRVSFEAFFTHILMHELMHGLGPHQITVHGTATTARNALQESYSSIEEAKADISGLWALQQLVDKGALPKSMAHTMYVTFLASSFRSIRFGLNEAHGKGMAMQLNYLMDAGAFEVTSDGRFRVNTGKAPHAVRALTHELLTIEAQGDRARADQLLARLGVIRPAVQRLLDQLAPLPVDIAPRFVTAEELGEPAVPR